MLDNKILSAQLLVKFTKPRKMEEEDYEKLLGAYMKPISDADGVTFKLKNGKKITGSNILRTKNVEIEMIDDVRISEPALIQEMEEFLSFSLISIREMELCPLFIQFQVLCFLLG